MTTQLPGMGRNGITNTVRLLSGYTTPGWRNVDSASEFIAGMVGYLKADTNGNTVVATVAANTNKPFGIFFCHKVTSFYKLVVDEEATAPAITTGTIVMEHAGIKADSCKVANASTGVAYTETSDYTINETNGIITNVSITQGTELLLTYLYEDTTNAGLDQTLGSGMVAIITDPAELALSVYDTTCVYTLGATVYATTSGYVTSTSPGGSAYTIGTVTKVPTADDPELYIRVRIS
jgi:hypothetical protein